jgi:hypothetical protein
MKHLIIAIGIAATAAAGLRAQDVKSETKITSDDAKTVMYTGCLQNAGGTQSYVLENAVPVKETKTKTSIDAAGLPETTTTTTMRYALVPTGKIDFQSNVGHRVQVTAMVVPAGDDHTKIESKTKTEIEGQKDQQTETKDKIAQGDEPQLHVVSIKHLADSCRL